jgi:hypothetical protein
MNRINARDRILGVKRVVFIVDQNKCIVYLVTNYFSHFVHSLTHTLCVVSNLPLV